MTKCVEQRKLVQGVNKTHPLPKSKNQNDWQESKFIKFHGELTKVETVIDLSEASRIVRNVSQKWSIRIEQLYPEKVSNMNYSWATKLGPRHGVIWVDSDMMYPSYILHELAHIIVECFICYDLKNKSTIREEGHGILFALIMYQWLIEYYQDNNKALDIIDEWFGGSKIHMADMDSYHTMLKIFKNRTLI